MIISTIEGGKHAEKELQDIHTRTPAHVVGLFMAQPSSPLLNHILRSLELSWAANRVPA